MRLVSLEPYITELLAFFGESENVVGISHRCTPPAEKTSPERVTSAKSGAAAGENRYFNPALSRDLIDLPALRKAAPEAVVATLVAAKPGDELTRGDVLNLQQDLSQRIGREIKLFSYNPLRLEQIFDDSDRLARELKVTDRGSSIGKRAKAQLMDWGANFYDRMKNKKVTFIANIEPLYLGGLWIPDMIHTLSAASQVPVGALNHVKAEWKEILEFRPDVILVAPQGMSLQQSMSMFKTLEKFPSWEEIPAVKRGEVIFSDGTDHFYSPGPKIIDSFGIMVSAIAGFESGYITKRDSFYRLRWLELQRHKL